SATCGHTSVRSQASPISAARLLSSRLALVTGRWPLAPKSAASEGDSRWLTRLALQNPSSRKIGGPPNRRSRREFARPTEGSRSHPSTSEPRAVCALPDHIFHWCFCHFGLAVLRRCSQRDDRELVSPASLVGTANCCADRFRHGRADCARHPFSRSAAAQGDVARSRCGTTNCGTTRRRPAADDG